MMKVILLFMFLTPLNLNFVMVSFYSVLCFLSVLIMVMSYKFGSNKMGYYGFN